MSTSDIHLYTASTMNGWKPVIFLEEAEVKYDLTYKYILDGNPIIYKGHQII